MGTLFIDSMFYECLYSKNWTTLYNHFDNILQNSDKYSQSLSNYFKSSGNMQYYLFAVAKNNKKQINTILSYHDKFSKFVSESDAKKYQEIASEMYFYLWLS